MNTLCIFFVIGLVCYPFIADNFLSQIEIFEIEFLEHLAAIYEATKNSAILFIIGAVFKIACWMLVILGVIVLTLVVFINNATGHEFTPWRFTYDEYEEHNADNEDTHISSTYYFPLLHRYTWHPLVTVSPGGNWHPPKTTRHTVNWYYGFSGTANVWNFRQFVGIFGGNKIADLCIIRAYLTTVLVYTSEELVTDYSNVQGRRQFPYCLNTKELRAYFRFFQTSKFIDAGNHHIKESGKECEWFSFRTGSFLRTERLPLN